ncbi:hypothetical protein EDB19DRAFT_227209 [Suillus lakei]|nr:hypothetical protein EDB19DRAFT_227209 [Suillus lakei]
MQPMSSLETDLHQRLQWTGSSAKGAITRSKSSALCLPTPDTLLPHQILNEVASISMISARCPDIPVPKIYAFSADEPNPLVAQKYIDGEPLDTIWIAIPRWRNIQSPRKLPRSLLTWRRRVLVLSAGFPVARATPLDLPQREEEALQGMG